MASKEKNKLEVLWQGFEKTGSIEAYLTYRHIKLTQPKAKEKATKEKATAKSSKSSR